jgi:hypothetical protein
MRYKILGSEVHDTQTGLIWRSTAEDLTYEKAQAYAERVAQETGQAWRVPTIDELSSLVDRSRCDPASTFPAMASAPLWSSSLCVGYSDYAWVVGFDYGVVDLNLCSYSLAVRLVRNS